MKLPANLVICCDDTMLFNTNLSMEMFEFIKAAKYFKIIPQAKGFCNLHLNFIPISVPPAKNSSEKEKNYHYVFMNIEELYLGSAHSLEKIL